MFGKVRKLTINKKDFGFKVTNRVIIKLDEKYDNAGSIIDGIMNGKQFFSNALKLLSCSCIEKEFTLNELIETIHGNQMCVEIPGLVTELLLDYIGINEDKDNEESKIEGKN